MHKNNIINLRYRNKKNYSKLQKPAQDWLPYFKQLFYAIWILSLTIGGLVLLLYLITERIFPTELTLGDSFLLIYTALIFGLVMLAGAITGAILSYWFFYLLVIFSNWNKKRKKSSSEFSINPDIKSKLFVIISISMNILILLILISTESSEIYYKSISTSIYFFAVGLSLLFLFGLIKSKSSTPMQRILIFATLTISLISAIKPMLLDITMYAAGIRSWPGQLISMNHTDQAKTLEIAKLHGLDIKFCNITGTDRYGTTDILVIWHHIGDISYVKAIEGSGHKKKSLLIPLSKEVEIYPSRNTAVTCG